MAAVTILGVASNCSPEDCHDVNAECEREEGNADVCLK